LRIFRDRYRAAPPPTEDSARYAVGYAVHESSGQKYVVRQRDAHAWCIVWNQAKGIWEDLDTTPAVWFAEEAKLASSWQFLSDAWSRLRFEFAKLRWGQTNLRQYVLWALVPVLGVLLYQIISRARRKRGGKKKASREQIIWPGLDSEFYLLEKSWRNTVLPVRPQNHYRSGCCALPAIRRLGLCRNNFAIYCDCIIAIDSILRV